MACCSSCTTAIRFCSLPARTSACAAYPAIVAIDNSSSGSARWGRSQPNTKAPTGSASRGSGATTTACRPRSRR